MASGRRGDRPRHERSGKVRSGLVGLAAVTAVVAGGCASSDDGGEAEGAAEWMCTAAADAEGVERPPAPSPEAAVDAWFDDAARTQLVATAEMAGATSSRGEVGAGTDADLDLSPPTRDELVPVRDGSTWAWTYAEGRRLEVQALAGPDGWAAGPGLAVCTTDP